MSPFHSKARGIFNCKVFFEGWTEKEWDCELALLALGFTGSEKTLADAFGLKFDFRNNIQASSKDYKTNVPGVFVAGDMRRGQS